MPTGLIIFGAKYLIAVIILVAGIFWLQLNNADKKMLAIRGAITLPVSFIIARLISLVFNNPRPFVVEHTIPLVQHAADNGFPSDHTLLAAACAALVWSYDKKFGGVLYVLAIIVGASRVAADVHHTIDIIGSLVIASVVVWAVVMIQKRRAAKHLQTPANHV